MEITKINMQRENELIGVIELAMSEYFEDRRIQMTKVQVLGCLALIMKATGERK